MLEILFLRFKEKYFFFLSGDRLRVGHGYIEPAHKRKRV